MTEKMEEIAGSTPINTAAQTEPRRLTMGKNARLRLRSLIDPLYEHGARKVTAFPIKANFRALSQEELKESFRGIEPEGIGRLQVMLTVPKRKLHHAVDRVAMRRRMREAWRLERGALLRWLETEAAGQRVRTLSVSLIYLADRRKDSAKVRERMRTLIAGILESLNSKEPSVDEKPSEFRARQG